MLVKVIIAVILSPDNYDLWLASDFRETTSVSKMLMPFGPALMRRYPVSTRINEVQNEDADCAKPLEPEAAAAQRQLF